MAPHFKNLQRALQCFQGLSLHAPLITVKDQQEKSILPLRRWADPKEISYVVLFLASDESSYCTGGEFAVDGGESAGLLLP